MKKSIAILLFILFTLYSCWSVSKDTDTKPIVPVQDNTLQDTPTQELPLIKEVTKAVIPTFTELEVGFEHEYQKKNAHPFLGWAMIDIDSDGVEELFVWWGYQQSDRLFQFKNNSLINITDQSGLWENLATTYGALSIDTDNDKDIDLYVAKADWIYLYINNDWIFSEQKLDINFPENTVPFSLSPTDWNQDGFVDLYISTFINFNHFKSATFNDENHKKTDIALENNGDNTFTNINEKLGIGYKQNTFISSFIDLNDDQKQDLVIAPNTDQIQIFQNINNEKFQSIEKLSDYGFWMGFAAWDIDNDGDSDLFFSNIGKTIKPLSIAKGDLKDDQTLSSEWLLLRNDGAFQFTDSTKEFWLTWYEFWWWSIFEDFNIDGRQDLIVSENYIKWPTHKLKKDSGRLLIQNEDGTFDPFEKEAGIVNKNYGQSPLITDFNNDGYPDLILLNINGPLRVFLNNGWNYSHLTVHLTDNTSSLWAKVTVETQDGFKITKQFFSSQWLMTDNSPDLYFGLWNAKKIKSVTVQWSSGKIETRDKVDINTKISF